MEISFIVKNIDENEITLSSISGEEARWSKKFFPENIGVGDTVVFEINSESDFLAKKNEGAKEILNEILNT